MTKQNYQQNNIPCNVYSVWEHFNHTRAISVTRKRFNKYPTSPSAVATAPSSTISYSTHYTSSNRRVTKPGATLQGNKPCKRYLFLISVITLLFLVILLDFLIFLIKIFFIIIIVLFIIVVVIIIVILIVVVFFIFIIIIFAVL